MFEAFRTIKGVFRSLRIYYGDPEHGRALDSLYRQFVRPSDLVFDIGAHVGDRVGAFRRLGARVVAVEPQPRLATTLRLLYGRDANVVVEEAAVGSRSGSVELFLNIDNPTISTASMEFIGAASHAPGWQSQAWPKRKRVALTTVSELMARHGMPSFIKIDVEGFEAEVLAGLSSPVPGLSFEFTLIQRDIALTCVKRCTMLGYGRFNAVLGESNSFVHSDWISAANLCHWLSGLPPEANSGDIYAVLG
jgi:FkbM family methyltransferase